MSNPKCDCGCVGVTRAKPYLHYYCLVCKKIIRKLTLAESCNALLHSPSDSIRIKVRNEKDINPTD